MKVYQPATDQMHRKDRAWCKTITKERVGEPFHIFAASGYLQAYKSCPPMPLSSLLQRNEPCPALS
eukprot:scaffold544_cov23-Tisochrysis_lutea.AAC.1